MPNLNISEVLTTEQKETIVTKASDILGVLIFLVNLNPVARKRLRKMATKRAGYVNDVFIAVLANIGAIPITFNIDEYKKDKQLHDDLMFVLNVLRPIVEAVEDTLLMLGNELMTQSDAGYDYLKRAAKGNLPLTQTVAQIATAYKRKAAKAAVTYTIGVGGSVTVENIKANTRLVNLGTTVIRIKADNQSTSTAVEPGNSELIAVGAKKIAVTNVSVTVEGIFSVRLK